MRIPRPKSFKAAPRYGVFRFVLFCFSFCFVVGGPGGGFGGPGGGFLLSSLSSGFAITFTTTYKATTRTTQTTPRTTEHKTKRKTQRKTQFRSTPGSYDSAVTVLLRLRWSSRSFCTEIVITGHHAVGQVLGVVEMNPTNLPELCKPSWDLGNLKETCFLETNIFREIRTC